MPRASSTYNRKAEMLQDQNENNLQKSCAAMIAEFSVVKGNYDEKMADLINTVIRFNDFMEENNNVEEDVQKHLHAFKEQTMELIGIMGSLMRTKKQDMDKLQLEMNKMAKNNPKRRSKRKQPVHKKLQKKKPAKRAGKQMKYAAAKRQRK